jgi:O-antigen ligase
MADISTVPGIHHDRRSRLADFLVIAIAVSLPWSTSATSILAVLWLVALVPSIDWRDLRRNLATPAAALPVLLAALGAAGMLWGDVSLSERWNGIDSFLKLLALPLLLTQFHRSGRGEDVFGAYLVSCVVLLFVSTFVQAFHPFSLTLHPPPNEVLVKNAATQSGEFVTCIFGLLFLASDAAERRIWPRLFVFALIMLGMLANMLYVATGRTALAIIPVLLVLFAARKLNVRTIGILFSAVALVGVIAWYSSPYLRGRTGDVFHDLKSYQAAETVTSSGERLVFWTKSIDFIRQAPLIGHGTGSIRLLFEKSATGQSGAAGEVSANPHNQTLAVGIQLGVIGIAVLWAMWIAHLLLFRGNTLAEWIGLVVVVQNIVGSLFNSHLFDFLQGWTYVVGAGVAGGMVLHRGLQSKNS